MVVKGDRSDEEVISYGHQVKDFNIVKLYTIMGTEPLRVKTQNIVVERSIRIQVLVQGLEGTIPGNVLTVGYGCIRDLLGKVFDFFICRFSSQIEVVFRVIKNIGIILIRQ